MAEGRLRRAKRTSSAASSSHTSPYRPIDEEEPAWPSLANSRAIPSTDGYIEIEDNDLLPKVPATIEVDKKHIFHTAADRLNLTVGKEETFRFDDETFITELEINNMITRDSLARSSRKFYGQIQKTETMSVQSAYQVCLIFLTEHRFIVIDDYNHHRAQLLNQQLFSSKSWAMLFETEISALHHAIASKNKQLSKLAATLKQTHIDPPSALPQSKQHQLHDRAFGPQTMEEPKDDPRTSLENIYNELILLSSETQKRVVPVPEPSLQMITNSLQENIDSDNTI